MTCSTISKILVSTVLVLGVIALSVSLTVGERSEDSCDATPRHVRRQSPNIVIIMADDMGWNDVGYQGSNQIPTPNIDALAFNGVILKNHYVLPVCTPSRTAFFSGLYPIRTGMYGFPLRAGERRSLPLNITLLPQHLQGLGYTTHMVGKWHLGYRADEFTPARRGFETFYGYYTGYITYYNYTILQSGHRGYDMHRDNAEKLTPDRSYKEKYATDMFTEEAVKVINEHNGRKPLYLQISHLAPHASDAEEPLETRDPSEIDAKYSFIQDPERRKYAGMMKALDDSVGHVVAALNKRKMLKNTIIVFMADNGAQTEGVYENHGSNYPLRGLKFTPYEGAVHGVACVYSPLIKHKSRVMNQLFHMTDWLPTLFSAAGGDVEDLGEVDGINQWPVLARERHGRRNSLLVNIDNHDQYESAIIGQYKLVRDPKPRYPGYYGEDGGDDDPMAPDYDIDAVLSSKTHRILGRTSGKVIKRDHILELREKSKIKCDDHDAENYANCSTICLFDLESDPCETTDISDQYPEMVDTLQNFIDGYREKLVEQSQDGIDPNAFPEHFGGIWMPWMNGVEL